MDLGELRNFAWEKYLEALEELDTVKQMYISAKSRKDLLKAKLISDLCERKVRILDRILARTDPVRAVVQSMSYGDIVHLVSSAEKKQLAGGGR
ncbi:MAG: hypothetical protein QXT26_05560 [Thermoproteota archaeon]